MVNFQEIKSLISPFKQTMTFIIVSSCCLRTIADVTLTEIKLFELHFGFFKTITQKGGTKQKQNNDFLLPFLHWPEKLFTSDPNN